MSKLLPKSHIFLILIGIGLSVFAAISIYYIAFFHVSPLSRDQWHMYAPYFEHGLLEAALMPMSTHRHLFPFVIFDMDMNLFGGRNHFLIFFGSLFDGLIIVLLAVFLKRDNTLSPFEKGAFFVLIISSLVWLINIAQLGWGFMSTQYYLAIFTYLFSIVSAYQHCHATNNSKQPGCSVWLCSSIVCGVICTFSFGIGILVWPALLYFFYLWRASFKVVVLIVVSLVFCLALFLLLPGGETIEDALLFSPKHTISFVFQLAGGPIYYLLKSYRLFDTESIKSLASIIGIIASSVGILLLLLLLKRRPVLSIFSTLCCALMLLGLGTAALISFTRNPFFLDVWVDRYQIWATLFWLGLLPLCYMQLNQGRTSPSSKHLNHYTRQVFLVCLCSLPLFALPSQLDMGARLSEYKIRVQEALLTYQVGIPDKRSAEEALHWNWENKLTPFFTVLNQLKIQKKNIYYVDYTNYLGKPIQDLAIQNTETITSLAITKTNIITHKDLLDLKAIPASNQFDGFDADLPNNIVAYQISAKVATSRPWTQAVITNEHGMVVGLGLAIHHSKLPRSNLKYIDSDYNLFAVVRNDGARKIRFYLLNGDDTKTAQVSGEVDLK